MDDTMRLTFTTEEYDLLYKTLHKHQESELQALLHKKFIESFPDKDGTANKIKAGKDARKLVERKNNVKIDYAIKALKSKNEKITVTSVAKEAKLSYNTANKYKVRITFAEADRKRNNEKLNFH